MVEIGLGAGMGQGPQGYFALLGFYNGADRHRQSLINRDNYTQIKFQDKPERIRLDQNFKGKRGEGLFFKESLPVVFETEDIPISGGGKVKFPVTVRIPWADEKLKAGILPQSDPSGRPVG